MMAVALALEHLKMPIAFCIWRHGPLQGSWDTSEHPEVFAASILQGSDMCNYDAGREDMNGWAIAFILGRGVSTVVGVLADRGVCCCRFRRASESESLSSFPWGLAASIHLFLDP